MRFLNNTSIFEAWHVILKGVIGWANGLVCGFFVVGIYLTLEKVWNATCIG